MRLLVFKFLILLSVTAYAQKSMKMKCVWAYHISNDTSYVFHDKLGTFIDIEINKVGNSYSSFVNNKYLRGNSEHYLSSRFSEVDYWLCYTVCHFSDDYSRMTFVKHDERLKHRSGTWYSDYYYYVQDISIEPFCTEEEFKSNWNKE